MAERHAMQDPAVTSWDSTKMLKIKDDWGTLWDTYRKTPNKVPGEPMKGRYEEVVRMFEALLRRRLSDEEVRHLAETGGSLPVSCKEWSEYECLVVRFIADVLVYSRDRENLVRLLSTRLPTRVNISDTIESYLARKGTRLKDPMSILGDAYSKCRIPEVRHDIATAVRRGFAGHGIRGKDDADFVNNAMRWYQQEEGSLLLNDRYFFNDECFPLELYERKPDFADTPGFERLFNRIPRSQRLPGCNQEPDRTGPKPDDEVVDWVPPDYVTGTEAENAWAMLEGSWELIESVASWGPSRREEAKGYQFVFHNGNLTWRLPNGKNGDQFRVRLGSPRQPRVMDLLGTAAPVLKRGETTALIYELQVETTSGIYELNGDALRICLPRRGAWQRPDSFEARAGSGETMYALKRRTF
jgi:uncharacterized protein (TIGR03067 family)